MNRPFPRTVFNKAKAALKKYLDLNYNEKEGQHHMGPPSIMNDVPGIHRDQVDLFFENCPLVVRHPLGGWMDARYKDCNVPSEGETRAHVIMDLENLK